MRYRKLGRTDVEVSVICAGCMTVGDDPWTYGHAAERDAVAALNADMWQSVSRIDT